MPNKKKHAVLTDRVTKHFVAWGSSLELIISSTSAFFGLFRVRFERTAVKFLSSVYELGQK